MLYLVPVLAADLKFCNLGFYQRDCLQAIGDAYASACHWLAMAGDIKAARAVLRIMNAGSKGMSMPGDSNRSLCTADTCHVIEDSLHCAQATYAFDWLLQACCADSIYAITFMLQTCPAAQGLGQR